MSDDKGHEFNWFVGGYALHHVQKGDEFDMTDAMAQNGFTRLLIIGDDQGLAAWLSLYYKDTPDEFAIIEVGQDGSRLLTFPSLAEALDAMGRWAPIVSAHRIAWIYDALQDLDLDELVKRIG